MQLVAFRIRNFRSIRDTGWQNLASDNITGLIGQNESGKTSVLEALHSFYVAELKEDYLRSDESKPEVSCSFITTDAELREMLDGYQFDDKLIPTIEANKNRINITRRWNAVDQDSSWLELEQQNIVGIIPDGQDTDEEDEGDDTEEQSSDEALGAVLVDEQEAGETEVMEDDDDPYLTKESFLKELLSVMPAFVFFTDFSSLLPAEINVDDISINSNVQGLAGVKNYLSICDLKLAELLDSSSRITKRKIDDANEGLTKEFQQFWSQYVGKNRKISIAFELKNRSDSNPETAGKPYLCFWVNDGKDPLSPAQRSQGVRWFLSFFLQLKARALHPDNGRVYLIDEPGASLHAKAQTDVLKLFDDIRGSLQIIYTTHSPYLIEEGRLYRLLGVQRRDDDEYGETIIIPAHNFEAASEDTLMPVYTLIGVGLQHQQVIQKKRNVILEEPSAFYYLKSFMLMLERDVSKVNFLPATGVTKIPHLVNLFLGWGLEFVVVTDDDTSGKKVRREISGTVYGGDSDESKKHLYGIEGCDGIEDVFLPSDFRKYVLGKEGARYDCKNSEYMKKEKASKVIAAIDFLHKVERGDIDKSKFSKTTIAKIEKVLNEIEAKL
jgi:energy-coupling factor transporter ATP-binding protein EcfA2